MRSWILPAFLGMSLLTVSATDAYADDAPPSSSGELPVAVLTVLTPDAFEAADALTVALKRAIADVPGYATADTDQSLQVLEISLHCGDASAAPGTVVPDAACEEKISDRIKQQRFVWARISKKGDSIKGDLHFYQRGLPTQSAQLDYSSNLTVGADETLIQVARAALDQAGAGPPKGKVKVTAGTITGVVLIDGKKVGDLVRGVGEFQAIAGSHKLTVKTPEGAEMTAEFHLAAFATSEIALTPPPEAPPGVDPKIVIGFGLVAAGAGLGVGGLYSSLKVNSIQKTFNHDYAQNYGADEKACTTTKNPLPTNHNQVLDLCHSASGFKTDQIVLYPLAAVAAGVGFALLGVSDWHPAKNAKSASVAVEPWVGKDGGFLSVRARF